MENRKYELADLVKVIKGHGPGEEKAFQQLYEITKRTALSVIKRYCDISEDYEDLLQETYICVFRSIEGLNDDTKALVWIRKIAANIAIRHNMKKWPTLFSDIGDEDEVIPEFEDEEGTFDPVKITDRKVVSEVITSILDSLPYDQRTALWMIYGQQVTIREMAASLGISENTIKSRLYQGRQKLMLRKDEFRKYGIELTVIPISILIAMTFEDTVYAAEAAGSAIGATATIRSLYKRNKGFGFENEKKDMLLKGAQSGNKVAGTVAGHTTVTTVKTSAVLGKLTATSMGVKAATVGVAVMVTVGAGIVAKHSETIVENQKETVQEESWKSGMEEEGLQNTTEQNSRGDNINKEKNRILLSYARDRLIQDEIPRPQNASSSFSVIDMDRDGIYEVMVFSMGECNAETRSYLIYMTKDDRCECIDILDGAFGIIQEKGQVYSSKYHMGVAIQVFGFQGNEIQNVEDFYYYEKDDPEYEHNPEENDANKKKHKEYLNQLFDPESVSITYENIEHYLGGDGILMEAHKVKAEDFPGMSESEEDEMAEDIPQNIQEDIENTDITVDIDADIEHIRATYAYTNAHIDEYERTSTSKNPFTADYNYEGEFFYDGDVEVKCVIERDGYYIELYEKNPSLVSDALSAQDTWPEQMAEFIFAIKDGCEYRIYIKEGYVIRYIAPVGKVNDYLEALNLDQFRCAVDPDEYTIVTNIFDNVFPGWHTSYCGAFEGD